MLATHTHVASRCLFTRIGCASNAVHFRSLARAAVYHKFSRRRRHIVRPSVSRLRAWLTLRFPCTHIRVRRSGSSERFRPPGERKNGEITYKPDSRSTPAAAATAVSRCVIFSLQIVPRLLSHQSSTVSDARLVKRNDHNVARINEMRNNVSFVWSSRNHSAPK